MDARGKSGGAAAEPEVLILMGVRDGAPWLGDQLESLAAQKGVRWRLLVSDDGSTDGSQAQIGAFAAARPERFLGCHTGPQRGAAANFLHLLRLAPEGTDWVALADQDDVWLPGKLARATRRLGEAPAGGAALYCGRTVICDEKLSRKGLSPLFTRPPSFQNALVQSLGGGNTMVLNRAGLDLARAAAAEAGEIVMHDWWLYQLVSGAGGTVIYDPEPQVLYRQHGQNQIGSNASLAARVARARHVAGGRLRRWNAINLAALGNSRHRLTPENQAVLDRFAAARAAGLGQRMRALRELGLYRQTPGGNASWWAAAAAGLI